MRPKLNSKDNGQMSTPNEYTDSFKSNLTCIFLSVMAKSKNPLCPWTLCTTRDLRGWISKDFNIETHMKNLKNEFICLGKGKPLGEMGFTKKK